jgi:hypothetical protein
MRIARLIICGEQRRKVTKVTEGSGALTFSYPLNMFGKIIASGDQAEISGTVCGVA